MIDAGDSGSAAGDRNIFQIGDHPPRLSSQNVPLLEYDFGHSRRGAAIIINNVNFEAHTKQLERSGSDVDAAALERMFMKLNFDIILYKNLKAREMVRVLKEASLADHADADCFACAVLSHGYEGQVFGTDSMVSVDALVAPFKSDACKSLVGKPKLFFIQACRGTKYDRGALVPKEGWDEADSGHSAPETKIPCEADFLLAYAVGPGYLSWRNSQDGSWFVQALCRVFNEHVYTMDILHLLTYVNRIIAYECQSQTGEDWSSGCKQVPSIVCQLTKLLYFRPKF